MATLPKNVSLSGIGGIFAGFVMVVIVLAILNRVPQLGAVRDFAYGGGYPGNGR